MITLYFPKYMRELTDGVESQKFDIEDLTMLISGLKTLFPKLTEYLAKIECYQITNVCYLINKRTGKIIEYNTKDIPEEIVFIVTIYGGGDDLGSILQIGIGIVLIAVSFWTGGSTLGLGISMTLGGIVGLLTPKPKKASSQQTTDEPVRADNDAYGALQNTTTTDMSVPLIFGYTRVPGQFVGGRIKTINHDASTVISVANYV